MEARKVHFQHILLYYHRKGKNASQAYKKLCAVYGDEVLNEKQCEDLFAMFRSGKYTIEGTQGSGPSFGDECYFRNTIDSSYYNIALEVADTFTGSYKKKLKPANYYDKRNVSIFQQFEQIYFMRRITMCEKNLKRIEDDPFLKRLITGTEKWLVYTVRTTPEAETQEEKIMLSIWWDYKGILFFELSQESQINSIAKYIQHLDKLNNIIQEKREELANSKGIIYLHTIDAYLYTTSVSNKVLALGWELLPHPPSSCDLEPSKYYLFRAIQESLNNTIFNGADDVKSHLIQFFADKNQEFYEDGIMTMPGRWQKIIDNEGHCLAE